MLRVAIGTFLSVLPLVFACGESTVSSPDPAQEKPVLGNTSASSPERVAIRHILIAHRDSKSGSTMVGRSRKDAKKLASKLRRRLLNGETMGPIARRFSNDTTAARGGFLGAAERGSWVQAFEDAAFGLAIDEISGIVETKYGFHILQREALHEVKLAHIVIAHTDSKGISRTLEGGKKRSPAEALEQAQDARLKLLAGSTFSEVAESHSDGPMGARGADLGWFVRGELGPDFDEVAFALEVGTVSEIIETIFGYHIVKRLQ